MRFKKITTFVLSVMVLSSPLDAIPKNPIIVNGEAHVEKLTANKLQITTSDRVIIDWDSFSIEPGQLVQFIQPNTSSAVLNRVKGSDVSKFLGALQSNGQVYLINPNGIVISDGALLQTGEMVLSTLDTFDDSFMSHDNLVFLGITDKGVRNLGTLVSTIGDVILIGYHVENQGMISASLGAVRIATGQEILMGMHGAQRVALLPSSTDMQQDGAAISNQGLIHAAFAEIKADSNAYLTAISQTGEIRVKGGANNKAKVYLNAEDGSCLVNGNIYAQNADGTGGEIRILGQDIAINNNALIDVSGEFGQGKIYVGGGFQGNNPLICNASRVFIGKDTYLGASASIEGNGGSVVIMADGETYFYGNIVSKGGVIGGEGGIAEVIGKQYLDFKGHVDLSAVAGNYGSLILE